MAWCSRCLIDHDGPCLDEVRRADFAAHRGTPDGRPCPFCGGGGSHVSSNPRKSERCAFCRGSGAIGW
jgi:hypothetical protein